ncbi:hypothetical protein [Wenzhouxiangella marina]|uniref:hypothetical protein n=1 Tax=Wenzhouxiangella marina TaxID=1579979 RepID=UPI0014707EE4|nr:hypothetical protein [Wenzhouxiangella marina]MBB6086870.1 hypothetical protein [Wenzhouxiangella marina]
MILGKGGEGKTTLKQYLVNKVLIKNTDFRKPLIVDVDLKDLTPNQTPDAVELLVRIRNKLTQEGLALPLFDFAIHALWSDAQRSEGEAKLDKRNLKLELEEGIVEVGRDVIAEFIENGENVSIKLLRFGLKQLNERLYRRRKLQARSQDHFDFIESLLKEQIIDKEKLEKRLPEILADDIEFLLSNWGAKKARTLVVVFDEFERVFDGHERIPSDTLRRIDNAINLIVATLRTRTLSIIFSRRAPNWGETSKEWEAYLSKQTRKLHGIPLQDAREWVRCDVDDDLLVPVILANAGEDTDGAEHYYALLIRYQLEHIVPRIKRGERIDVRSLDIRDRAFDDRKREIISRVLRDYDRRLRAVIEEFCYVDYFNEALFNEVIGQIGASGKRSKFSALTSLSVIRERGNGFYEVTPAVADIIRSSVPEEEGRRIYERLLESLNRLIEVPYSGKFSYQNVQAVSMAVSIAFRVDHDRAIEIARKAGSHSASAGYARQLIDICDELRDRLLLSGDLNDRRDQSLLALRASLDLSLGDNRLAFELISKHENGDIKLRAVDVRWMILLARSFEDAERVFNAFEAAIRAARGGVRSQYVSLVRAMIKKSPTSDIQDKYIELLFEIDEHVDSWVLRSMIRRASGFEEAWRLVLDHSFIKMDHKHVGFLMQKYETREDLENIKELMSEHGVQLNQVHRNILFQKRSIVDPDDVFQGFEDERRKRRNIVSYTQEINVSSNFEEAHELFVSMIEEGIVPDYRAIGTLAEKVGDPEDRRAFLDSIDSFADRGNWVQFQALLHQVDDLRECLDAVQELLAFGVEMKLGFAKRIGDACQRYARGPEVSFDEISQHRLRFDSLCERFDAAEGALEEWDQRILVVLKRDDVARNYFAEYLKPLGVQLRAQALRRMMLAETDFDSAMQWVVALRGSDSTIAPDVVTSLAKKCRDWSDSKQVLELAEQQLVPVAGLVSAILRAQSEDPLAVQNSIKRLMDRFDREPLEAALQEPGAIRAMIVWSQSPDMLDAVIDLARKLDIAPTASVIVRIAELSQALTEFAHRMRRLPPPDGVFSPRIATALVPLLGATLDGSDLHALAGLWGMSKEDIRVSLEIGREKILGS